jgi:hypothetical protein
MATDTGDSAGSSGAPGFDYRRMVHDASIGVVRSVLERVAADGLPGDHHLFLTFSTRYPGVGLAAGLAAQYPETMTVVLENQFWDLAVEREAFEVTLRFGGALERLRVPFAALTTFIDPSVPFGLDLAPFGGGRAAELPELAAEETAEAANAAAPGPEEQPEEPEPPPGGGDVLPFRRR